MKVLFDHQCFSMQKFGGISRCFIEIYKHLPESCKATIAVKESNNIYAQELLRVNPIGYQYDHFMFSSHFRGKMRLHKWCDKLKKHKYYPDYNKNNSIDLLKEGNFDLFHPTFFDDYFLPYLNGKPFVLTIHDMIPELYPQYFAKNDFQIIQKQKLAPLADAIIVVSENTKRDVIRLMNIPEEKIHVVYHGCSFKTEEDILSFTFPYILYVGDRYGYKNFVPFVKALIPTLNKHKDIRVICTGKSFTREEQYLLKKEKVEDRFDSYFVKTDSDLFSLYHHAIAFVYPSEYEGFGIPILEAYQADCPVLLNRTSCFPEIAGEAALFFMMDSNQSNLAEQMEALFSMSSIERDVLLYKQRERLSHYSWERSAKQLAALYQKICASL